MSARLYRLVLLPEVEAEIADAAQWCEERGLGYEFLRAFRAATAPLRRNPFLYQIIVDEARRVLLRRCPYGVIYEVHGAEVVLLACFHSARDPRHWQERRTIP